MISKSATWQKLLEQRHGTLFFGREREQELFRLNFLYQVPAYLIFAVHGPDGIGKSALLSQYHTIAQEHNAVTVQVDAAQATAIREQTILQTLLGMAQQFAAAGTPFTAFEERYEEYTVCTRMVAEDFNTPAGVFDLLGDIAEAQEVRTEAWNKYLFERFGNPTKIALVKTPVETLTQIFVKDMNAWATVRPMLLCFDDWEHLAPHLQGWLQDWLTRYEMRTNIWVALAGTQPPDETWTAFRPVMAIFELPPFTEAETRACLASAGVADADRVNDILTFSERLPVMVRLLASATGGSAGDLALTPVDRYLKWLEPPERRDIVLQCAVARRLDADVVRVATDSSDAALVQWLLESPLVIKQPGYGRYHPELRRRLLAFAQQQMPALVQSAHTRLHDYYRYRRRSAGNGGLTLYRDARWRGDKLEALYHGLMLRDVQTIQEGVETFLGALRIYYPLAGEIAATWQEAAEAQLTPNIVGEWNTLLHDGWHALEHQDWEAALTFCETCAQREDLSAAAQREIQEIRRIVLARLGRFAPMPEAEPTVETPEPEAETVSEMPEPEIEAVPEMPEPAAEVVLETPAPEEIIPEPTIAVAEAAPEGTQKETPFKVAELKHEAMPSPPEVMPEPLPDVDREAKTVPIPRLQVKETPMKEDLAGPPEAVTPKVAESQTAPAEPLITQELEAPEVSPTPDSVLPTPTPETPEASPTPDSVSPTSDYLRRAAIYLNMGEYEKAIREFNQALALDPTCTQAYYDRGLAYAQRQYYEQAAADFSRVIELDPQHADAYYNRGLIYARQGTFEQALADYNQAIALNPDDPLAYNSRGNVYYHHKDYARALADYDQAILRDPDYADAYLNRGLTYAAQEEYQHAIADYNQAIALNPENAIAYNYRGQAYMRLQQYAQALEDYTQAVTLDPHYAVAYNNRGLCYVRLKQYAQAIAEYRQAVIANPQYATAYYNAACAAGLMNNASVACTWLEKAIELNPRYRTMAQRDSDFDFIRGNKRFQALLTED
ncbi:MAG TPA: tetratricopeptide repeat protein [Anaerolineae bacterium]|nr:tetratricopeptide repeat protein [Anaerolineae bacterium]HQK14354.1 tetratricopeptide repeat protein [Anaerolineae bacterium]